MIVLRTQLAGVARRPVRLLLTGLSVLIAAFVVFGAVLAHDITARTTLDNFSGTPAATDLVIDPGPARTRLTAGTLAAIRKVPGVAEAVGRSEGPLVVTGRDNAYLQLTADPGAGPQAQVRVVEGRYPSAPHELALTSPAARRLGVAGGGRITVKPMGNDQAQPVTVTVTGIVEGASNEKAYAPDTVALALGSQPSFDRIDVHLAPGASRQSVTDGLRAAAANMRVVDGKSIRMAEAKEAVRQLDDVFALATMFIAVAVAAAGLVATSTFRIVFAQRMRQLALLRTIGAGRGQLIRALATEGAVTGLVAGVLGVAGAAGAGYAVPVLLRGCGIKISSPGEIPVVPGVTVVIGAVLLTLLAVAAPAVSAAGVAPLQALRGASTTAGRRGIGALRLTGGLIGAGVAAGVAAAAYLSVPDLASSSDSYNATDILLEIVVSGMLAFLALIALGPLLVRPILAAIGWPLRRLGPVGRLAVSGVGGTPRRAAAVSVIVALGATLIAGSLVGAASLQAYADRGLAVQAPADFLVHAEAGLPASLVDRMRASHHLSHVTPYREANVAVSVSADVSADARVCDLDLTALPALRALYAATGSLDALQKGEVIVNASTAEKLGLRAGDTVRLASPKATIDARVTGTLPADAPSGADIIVNRSTMDALGAAAPSAVFADAAGDRETAVAAVESAVRSTAGTAGEATVDVLANQRDDLSHDLSGLLAAALGLLSLTVLIAVVGVGTTTALSVVERVRECGLLRALGLSRTRLRLMLTTEASLYGILGATLGVLLGVPYGWLAIVALRLNAPLRTPAGQLVALLLILAAATAVAGLLPARRGAQASPVTALGTDE
jgi:putative ABC transport system permease protein